MRSRSSSARFNPVRVALRPVRQRRGWQTATRCPRRRHRRRGRRGRDRLQRRGQIWFGLQRPGQLPHLAGNTAGSNIAVAIAPPRLGARLINAHRPNHQAYRFNQARRIDKQVLRRPGQIANWTRIGRPQLVLRRCGYCAASSFDSDDRTVHSGGAGIQPVWNGFAAIVANLGARNVHRHARSYRPAHPRGVP